jgi:hypothetical protein
MWHKTDWSKVKDDPKSIGFPREDWIHEFDVEKHAEEVFDSVFDEVKNGGTSAAVETPLATLSNVQSVGA